MNITISGLSASIHDTSFGGYPFKVTATIQVDSKQYNKLKGDLGSLVLTVNNVLYSLNSNIPAYNPSIDSEGSKRASKGIKTLEFVYFFKDTIKAKNLGFEFHSGINSDYPKYGQYINLASK